MAYRRKFLSFLRWVITVEPSLHNKLAPTCELDKPQKDVTTPVLFIYYKEALSKMLPLKSQIGSKHIYLLTLYRLALHYAIFYSSANVNDEVDLTKSLDLFNDEKYTPLQRLYLQYKVYTYNHGILNMYSTSTTSGSTVTPLSLQNGNLETSYLLSTPYGRAVEMVYESLLASVVVV